MSKKTKVGILGGSFDPVHFGHVNLALSLKEACMLDEVFFVPAGISPFKMTKPPVASSEHRLKMLKLAIAPLRECSVIDWELAETGPSYAIQTVRKLVEDPSLELHLLLGEDQVDSFASWKQADELIRLAPPLIGTRNYPEKSNPEASQHTIAGEKVKIPLFDISSTFIRERLAKKKYCGHLIPTSVLDYIEHHHLYSFL